jgi:hypothetical protein
MTPAYAERVTKLFPLSGTMPKSLRDVPAELTRVVAKTYSAELAATPIEDAAELIGCNVGEQTCLASITEKVGASTIMFGRIERGPDAMIVKLSTFDPRKGEQQKSFTISGASADELSESLVERLDNAKPKAVPPTGKGGKGTGKPEDDDNGKVTEPPPVRDDSADGKITTGTWGLIIAGGVGVGVGAGFLFAANNLRDDINKAPTRTGAEIEHLRGIERAARTRLYVGAGLAIAGGAVATIGIVRAMMQKKQPSHEQPLVDVVPENGGASILLNLRWP